MISHEHIIMVVTALIVGTLARVLNIKEDYRQYPSYPNGYLIHVVTGFIAAALGAVAIPALMTKNFMAVTFLTLAIQQFRDIRKVEKESLKDLESTEFIFRGSAYIDGISKTFEARNYVALIVSFSTALAIQLTKSPLVGIIIGTIVFYVINRFSKGKVVGDIADVVVGNIKVNGSELFVDDIYVSNLLGTDNAKKLYESEGMAVIVKPRADHLRITLDNFGQREAMVFEASRSLGVKRYIFSRKEYEKGWIIITLVPIIKDIDILLDTVKNTPLLENVKKSHSVIKTNLVGRE